MGKVTVFCLLSGCTPEIASSGVSDIFELDDIVREPGPVLLEALRTLVDEYESRGQEDVTVIGAIHEDGRPFFRIEDRVDPLEDVLRISDSSIRVIPHCSMGEFWDFGCVDAPLPNPLNIKYLISFGAIIMVQTASLPILALATGGRVTPERLWRLAMHQGKSTSHDDYGLPEIDYGEMTLERKQFPDPIPGISREALIDLERLEDVELVKKAIMNDGKFWIWMAPDRFPIGMHSSDPDAIPILLEPPTSRAGLSSIEKLPVEVLTDIALLLPLRTFLAFPASSRSLRFQLWGFASDRNAMVRKWIKNMAPWYEIPRDVSSATNEGKVGWAYLKRCTESGSMRNRWRIWLTAERIEKLADKMGV